MNAGLLPTAASGCAQDLKQGVAFAQRTWAAGKEFAVVGGKKGVWLPSRAARPAALLGTALFQCTLEARDQAFLAYWFGEEGERSALKCGRAHVLLGIRRHEDGGNVMASAEQPPLQIDATDTRHAHVRDQARGILQPLRAQKFFGRRKRCRHVAVGFQKAGGRLANRQIIIDDRN